MPTWVLCLALMPAIGRGAEPDAVCANTAACDTVFTQKVYFRRASSAILPAFADNESHIGRIRDWLAGVDTADVVTFRILGSASPEGSEAFNRLLARRRATALATMLSRIMPVKPEIASTIDFNATRPQWPQARYAAVTLVRRRSAATVSAADYPPLCDTLPADNQQVTTSQLSLLPDTAVTEVTEVYTEVGQPRQAVAVAPEASGTGRVFVSTNMLYDLTLTPNIGVGVYMGHRLTLFADWMYARWSKHSARKYWHIWGGDAELRYQLGHGRSLNALSGHYVGVYASMVRYDFQFGVNRTGVLTDDFNYAAGICYGYSLPVGRRLNLDFHIGLGYAWGTYKKHHKIDDHDVWDSTHSRSWWGPTRLGISLTWLLGPNNVNIKKQNVRP